MKKITFSLLILLFFVFNVNAQRVTEKLNRGLVAVRTSSTQVFVSWRYFGSDPENMAFNLYRDGVKVNSTPISSSTNYIDAATTVNSYTVKSVINGVETGESMSTNVWNTNYLDINLDVPADLIMPDNSTCSYRPNDCSVGDVDGDGEFELVVKWDPSNAKDNSQSGYTGNVYIDVYKLNSTKLCRIDLGVNIRAGAHYTQFQVADYDGDGKAEITCKTAPGTKDGLGNFISKGPAATAIHSSDYRNSSGYILSGPEYLTVFSGLTGAELATAEYSPVRGTVSSWGDGYGNRVDRFLAATAYIDGISPSIIMCRGYYTRATVAAWNYRNGQLTKVWMYDSGTGGTGLYGQGNHNLSVGDVDNDGKDEIVWGAGAVDDDGKLLYRTGLGHGDAMHLSDLDPDRKGLEVWDVHEETGSAYGEELHDARTGEILTGLYTGSDNGRGLAVNVVAGNRGFEMWSASGNGMMSKTGELLSTTKGSMNFRTYWDGDLQDELLDNITISKYGVGSLMSATDCSSNNSTKATPNLSADILGDWREELILRTSDNTKLRIFTTTIATGSRIYTLMHDAVYRNAIAWQNSGYNQPPHAGFYIGDDMDAVPLSEIYNQEKRWNNGSIWDVNSTIAWKDSLNTGSKFNNGDAVIFDISAGQNTVATLNGQIAPNRVIVNSPYNVIFTGTGSLSGNMELKKAGSGILKLNNTNTYSGRTSVWNSELQNNGLLENSEVLVSSFGVLSGTGSFGKNVVFGNNSTLSPGTALGDTRKLTFLSTFQELNNLNYIFDFKVSGGQVLSHDSLFLAQNWILSGISTLTLNVSGGVLPTGTYTIIQCNGTITGEIGKIKIIGIPVGYSYSLQNQDGSIILYLDKPKALYWNGTVNNIWDNGKTSNWLLEGAGRVFNANDSIIFTDDALQKGVSIAETTLPSSVEFNNTSSNYYLSGAGSLSGKTGLIKNGDAKLSVSSINSYTGITMVNGGTIETAKVADGGVASPLGAATNSAVNFVLNGGHFSYTGLTASTDRGISLGAKGGAISVYRSTTALTCNGLLTGSGELTKEGAGKLIIPGANNYTGGTNLLSGILELSSDVANSSGLGVGDTIKFTGGTLNMFDSNTTDNTSIWNLNVPASASGTLNVDGRSTITGTLSGSGTLNYYTNFTGNTLASDASNFYGTLNVTTDADGGQFVVYSTKGYENAKIVLNNKVTMLYKTTSNIIIPVGDLSGTSSSVLGAGGTGASTIKWQVGAANLNSVFNGLIADVQISGTGAVTSIDKVGSGSWKLTNTNTYSGGTQINQGNLIVANTVGSALGSGLVAVNNGGTLSGAGFVSGNITVNNGGTLSPGDGIGTLSVANVDILQGGVLSVDIDKTNSKSDLLAVSGVISFAGKLELVSTNTTLYAIGDEFKIINGTITGLPSEIIPASPGSGLEWDLTDFSSKGSIKVKAVTAVENIELKSMIYPVPCNNSLFVKLDAAESEVQISIVDLIGKEVYNKLVRNQSAIKLDVHSLKSGVYMLHVKANNKLVSTKIIKE